MSGTGLSLNVRLVRKGFTLAVDLTLPGRGISVLFGPSGSGKTSCLRVLAGLEDRAQGTVVVDGQTWQDSRTGVFLPTHRRALGYVFQEASLFDHLTVEGNLRFGFERIPADERRHDWRHGLDLLGIGHLLNRRPHELSGGERQRVAIARALATSPRLLLMDEPLAALDAARKTEILPWLEQLHERLDMPVVYVTHSMDEVTRLADHLVLLDGGQVRAEGTVTDLLTRLDLPLAHGDHAGAVLLARTGQAMPEDQLMALELACGRLLLPRHRDRPGTRRPRPGAGGAGHRPNRQPLPAAGPHQPALRPPAGHPPRPGAVRPDQGRGDGPLEKRHPASGGPCLIQRHGGTGCAGPLAPSPRGEDAKRRRGEHHLLALGKNSCSPPIL